MDCDLLVAAELIKGVHRFIQGGCAGGARARGHVDARQHALMPVGGTTALAATEGAPHARLGEEDGERSGAGAGRGVSAGRHSLSSISFGMSHILMTALKLARPAVDDMAPVRQHRH